MLLYPSSLKPKHKLSSVMAVYESNETAFWVFQEKFRYLFLPVKMGLSIERDLKSLNFLQPLVLRRLSEQWEADSFYWKVLFLPRHCCPRDWSYFRYKCLLCCLLLKIFIFILFIPPIPSLYIVM